MSGDTRVRLPLVAGAPIMGLRPFVVTVSARVKDWEGDYTLEFDRLVYAADPELAVLRASAGVVTARPEIPVNCWNFRARPEPATFTGDTL